VDGNSSLVHDIGFGMFRRYQAKASEEFCCVATDVPEFVVDFELNI
jgi:hypothetical protein